MGKKKILSEEELKEPVLPEKAKLLERVVKLLGSDHIMVNCTDEKTMNDRED